MMKTTALCENNPLPPGGKEKSKARQHAKSKRKEKLKKEEISSKETGDTSFYDSDPKFFINEELLAAMNKERLLGLGPDQEMYPRPVTDQEYIAFFDLDVEEYELMANIVRNDCLIAPDYIDSESCSTNSNLTGEVAPTPT